MTEETGSEEILGGSGQRERTEMVSGTLIRGADGKIYFIPDENLADFYVADEEAHRQLVAVHEGQTEVIQTHIDARRISGSITLVVVVKRGKR